MATAEAIAIQHIRLQDAYLCQDCDCVGNCATQCPACASAALLCLSAVLNREEEEDYGLDDEPSELDVCHHGVGFDEECVGCELEDEMENAAAALGVTA